MKKLVSYELSRWIIQLLVPSEAQIRRRARSDRTGLRLDAHHNLHPRFQDFNPDSLPSLKPIPMICKLKFETAF